MRLFGYELSRVKPSKFLGDITRIGLAEGDVCVVMVPGRMTDKESGEMGTQWRAVFGDGVTLMILDEGKRIGVLSPPQAVQAHQAISDAKEIQAALDVSI